VVGKGAGRHFQAGLISNNSFDILTHIVLADETHLWFEKGVGLTGIWDWHNGTFFEYRKWLIQFTPASGTHPNAPGQSTASGTLRRDARSSAKA
jgi:hypothetical protein